MKYFICILLWHASNSWTDVLRYTTASKPILLLLLIEHYGFRGTSNLWFKNYLKGRKQYTSIRGVDSSLKEISCGVTQGSILGPILFLILINDLPKASKFFTILFADDTTLQLSSKSLHDLNDLANFELSKIEDWFTANKLT